MQIRRGDTAYACSDLGVTERSNTKWILISTLEYLSPEELESIFRDDAFYFYDEVLQGRLPDTSGLQLIGVNITYLADSTCRIILKYKKGDVDDESNF